LERIIVGRKERLMSSKIHTQLFKFTAFFWLVLACTIFVIPEGALAARIAGENQTVSTVDAAKGPVSAPEIKKLKVIGNRDVKFYYLPGMKDYDKIKESNRVEFNSEEEAIRAGYRKAPGVEAAQTGPSSPIKPSATTQALAGQTPAKTPPQAALPSAQTAQPPVQKTAEATTQIKPQPQTVLLPAQQGASAALSTGQATQQKQPSITQIQTPQQSTAGLPSAQAQTSPQKPSGPVVQQMQAPAAPAMPPKMPPPVSAQTPPPAPPVQAPAKDTRYVTIDFDNVDIQVFIRFISEMTGKNFIVDEKVKGKVTILSPRKISVDEAYKVFESVLDVNGFAALPAGDVIKVIPIQSAREKMLETRVDMGEISPEDKMITQIISLDHANPDEMKKVLEPLMSKTSAIISYAPTGMLVVSDLMSNIKKLREIVEALDTEGVGEQISYIPLKNSTSADLVKSLTAVFQQQKGMAPVKVVSDDRSNAIILMATEIDTARIKELITLMDKGITKGDSLLHVYRLQNANSEDLAKVLMNIPKDAKAGAAQTGKAVLSKDVSILSDKATNTLIITAERADYVILESVIKQLDVSRPMVYIEALIMEVNANKDFRLGVEWRGVQDYTGSNIPGLPTGSPAVGIAGSGGGAAGTGGSLAGGYNILPSVDATTKALNFPSGFAVGLLSGGISIGGVLFPSIGAVLQTYKYDSDVSILATPQIMTLDNEDAEINVGSNVPYITRSDVSSVTTTSTAVYGTSYDYKDVSTVLKITPHINDDQYVRLKIDQQVTKLASTSSTNTPTTLKRAAKTTVVVKDNETVVIGGLIDDSSSESTYKVPLLGDIPLIGWLFKSFVKTNQKTNLFVFITPHIIRTPKDASAMYKKKIEDAGDISEEGVIKLHERKLKKSSEDKTEPVSKK
jgi:general secretion pathway protein D